MKILLISGDHPRHLNFVDNLSLAGFEIFWFVEKRENMIPKAPSNISSNLKRLFKLHFDKRLDAENRFFNINTGAIARKNINYIKEYVEIEKITNTIKKKINEVKPEILISFGCSIIPDKILKIPKFKKINIHLGLSPWYKGAATHFWPSYFLEPEYTGITVHDLSNQVDSGPIIYQEAVNLNFNDGIHENACRVTKEFNKKFPMIMKKNIKILLKKKGIPQHTSGRNFTTRLWKPEMLKLVYELFDDKINKYCIENRSIKKVKLKSIF